MKSVDDAGQGLSGAGSAGLAAGSAVFGAGIGAAASSAYPTAGARRRARVSTAKVRRITRFLSISVAAPSCLEQPRCQPTRILRANL
jgi:hypothetical protein